MKFSYLLILLLSFTIISCDDSSSSGGKKVQPDPSVSTIEAEPAVYDASGLQLASNVTVTVKDIDGNPLENKYVWLTISDAAVNTDATALPTDTEGKAVFKLSSTHILTTEVSAYVTESETDDASVMLDATATVTFSLDVEISPAEEPEYSATGGSFPLQVKISDSQGIIASAGVTVFDTDDASAVFDNTSYTTNASGKFVMSVETALDGTHVFNFTVEGMDDTLEASYIFRGPELSGTIFRGMEYSDLVNTRVSVVAFDLANIKISEELPVSASFEMISHAVNYTIYLPIIPPDTDLTYEPGDDAYYGVFPVIAYNDENDNHVWDSGEPIIAANMNNGIPLFAKSDNNPDLSGWSMIEKLEENPRGLDWDSASSRMDFSIFTAPVNEPLFHGTVVTSNTAGLRVAFFIADINEFTSRFNNGENGWNIFFESDFAMKITETSINADGTYSATGVNPFDSADATTLQNWSLSIPLGSGYDPIVEVVVFGILYRDLNGNENFDDGDNVVGSARAPFGSKMFMTYVLSYDDVLGLNDKDNIWLHKGYNIQLEPKNYTIQNINTSSTPNRITLVGNIEPGHNDVPFSVFAPDAPRDSTPIATGTFNTNATNNTNVVEIQECTGCDAVASDDVLIITAPVSELTYFDWTKEINIYPF